MKTNHQSQSDQRRTFLKQVATGAAVLGTGILASPFSLAAETVPPSGGSEPDEWFKQVKGAHKIVFDATGPNGMMPFAWPRVFTLTNAATGTPEKDCGVVVVLRHNAIPYALNNQLWEKYKFGEMFKIMEEDGKTPATKNPFWQPAPGTYKVPGIGPVQIGINELQDTGIKFCACGMAITVFSAIVAMQGNQDAATVKNEWIAGLLPGIQLMPSGVWAVGRAQEHGCAYCFAG
ncbi:MAG: twin-arginine translocation signal domain-containing protein [Mucilaginibacter sp.]